MYGKHPEVHVTHSKKIEQRQEKMFMSSELIFNVIFKRESYSA